jgi:hypothetical protein
MYIPKKYIHDKLILFLLSVNIFLAVLCITVVLIRVGIGSNAEGYIIEYRPNLGLSAFRKGSIISIFGFVVFPLLTLIVQSILSIKTYVLHRMFSVTILSLGVLLAVTSIIVSNALLSLY